MTRRDFSKIAALRPSAEFQALLRRERSRSDRDGSEFSLAVFSISALNYGGRRVERAVNSIRAKMRSIDEIGWLQERNIGVLLPATNLQGALQFAKRVSGLTHPPVSTLPWTVHSYPVHWPAAGSDTPQDKLDRFASMHEAPSRLRPVRRADRAREAQTLAHIFVREIPVWKRVMDIVGSLVLIGLLSPVFLLLSGFIKCVSPGKILFRQVRIGYRGKPFTFLKFRTMHENSDSSSHREHLKELIKGSAPMEKLDESKDPRIIAGGKIIRKACLDELPQLFNVLRGEMSLVGPRPCIPYEAEEYLRWHTQRFDILPGMTGLWQVSGKNRLTFEQMIRLDITYSRKMSPLLDLKILLLTLPTVVGLVLEAAVGRLSRRKFSSDRTYHGSGNGKGTFSNA